ncbi:MAG: ATP-binding cassette domain-containing protein [Acetobacteraceae bacterium]
MTALVHDYLPVIDGFDPTYSEEMRGIAAGADVSFGRRLWARSPRARRPSQQDAGQRTKKDSAKEQIPQGDRWRRWAGGKHRRQRPTRSAPWCGTSRSTCAAARRSGCWGPNGAGKTTTFYMIVGLVRPDTGSISLDGKDITDLPMYRRARLGIGYLPQEASVFRGLNVEQNIMAALEVVEPDADQRRRHAGRAAGGVRHLPSAAAPPALALSGGERRRVDDRPRAWPPSPATSCWTSRSRAIDPIAVGESATWSGI